MVSLFPFCFHSILPDTFYCQDGRSRTWIRFDADLAGSRSAQHGPSKPGSVKLYAADCLDRFHKLTSAIRSKLEDSKQILLFYVKVRVFNWNWTYRPSTRGIVRTRTASCLPSYKESRTFDICFWPVKPSSSSKFL